MLLGIGLYDSPTGALIYDLAARGAGQRFSSGEHGFDTFTCFLPLTLADAFRLYDRPGILHVSVTFGGLVVWEGRLEDVAIVDGGVRLTAFGYWRALSDAPYTALWSATRMDSFIPTLTNAWNPERYQMDQNDRLFIALQKNSVYSNGGNIGGWVLKAPHGGERKVQHVSMDYSYVLPVNWAVRLVAWNDGFLNLTATTITAVGGTASGTATWDLSATPRDWVGLDIFNFTGGNYTYLGENGVNHITVSALRVKTTTSAAVYADEIVDALVAFVNGLNSSQLSSGTGLVRSPAVDLQDELYEDVAPADIIDRLARLGDDSDPVQLYEAGVWVGRAVSFQRHGATARQWYVDASSVTVERTLDSLHNSVYATYQADAGRALRTDVSADANSAARHGLARRAAVRASTTDETQAETQRDASLNDGQTPRPRIRLRFKELYDANGVRFPAFMARAWDTLTIRNLPPTLSTDIDRLRTFRLSEVGYDVPSDMLDVTPEGFLPLLETLLARQAAGVQVA